MAIKLILYLIIAEISLYKLFSLKYKIDSYSYLQLR